MKAVIWTRYGPPEVLQLQEVAKPAPKDNEVLIRIHATTAATADCELRNFSAPSAFWLPLRLYIGLFRPVNIKILGQELAGEVESVGKDVTRYKPGDQVFGSSDFHLSTYAEYICLPEKAMLAIKPANLTYEQAAAVPLGGPEALQYLQQANIQRGQQVLVIGAGGSIGTYGVQLARYFGAEVTGVDRTEKLDMLRSIGAEHVVDYTQEDFTRNGQTYDVIFDAPGKSTYSRCKRSLKPKGQYLSANGGLSQQLRAVGRLITNPRRAAADYASRRQENLLVLKELIEAGEIKPIIDRRYTLAQAADAHQYVDTGLKKGNVVITLEAGGKA